jgi:hypothetical protein
VNPAFVLLSEDLGASRQVWRAVGGERQAAAPQTIEPGRCQDRRNEVDVGGELADPATFALTGPLDDQW